MKTLQVRIPEELRRDADEVLEAIGMDMSTAIRVYLKKVVQERRIPFLLEAPDAVVVQSLDVDATTQRKMDGVASAWKRKRS